MSMSKKIKKKAVVNPDRAIDSIIEETRLLSEQEKMEKEAVKMTGAPKMEEIYSNKSKEVRLTNHNPLDDPDDDVFRKAADSDKKDISEETEPQKEEADTVVTLTPEYDEDTKISEEIIESVDGFTSRSVEIKDVDGIDIDLDEEEDKPKEESTSEEKAELPLELKDEKPEEFETINSFERLFGKPKPVSAVQTVVSKVPVYQHESKVDKINVRAGKFSAVVETEYKKYIASPNPVISQNMKPEPESTTSTEEPEKPSAGKIATGIAGKVVGFFSSHEDDEPEDFRDKTIQIEDYRSQHDAKSIVQEVNSNIRKMFVNSIFTGILFVLTLTLTIVDRIISHSITSAIVFGIVNLVLLLASCWICRVTIMNGLQPLKKFKGNSDTGAAVAAFTGIIQACVAAFIPRDFFGGSNYLYTSIVILALMLNCLGKLFMVLRVKDNFAFISSKTSTAYAAKIYTNKEIAQQLTSGTVVGKPIIAYQHETDFPSDFLRLSYSPDPSEDMASKIAPVTILCSLFVAILYAIISGNIIGAVSALAVMSCVSAPVCDLLAVNFPLRRLCKDTLRKNAMISGYPAVRQFCDTKAVICRAQDLYPADSITLNGVKAFSNHKVTEGMLAAAAILKEAGNPMVCVFNRIIEEQGGKLPKVESVMYEDNLGLVGWIDGERILIGNRSMLDKYAIMPPAEEFEEKQKKEGRLVTYIVRSGELLAMLVTTYDTNLKIAEQLQIAEANGVSLLVHSTDCNVTGEKIASDFGIYYRSVKVLPTGLGNVCQEITSAKEDSSRAYLSTRGSFLSLIRAISGCIRLKSNISLAVVIQLIGIILGVLIMSSLTLFAGAGALKNLEILLFVVFWAAASLIAPSIQKP